MGRGLWIGLPNPPAGAIAIGGLIGAMSGMAVSSDHSAGGRGIDFPWKKIAANCTLQGGQRQDQAIGKTVILHGGSNARVIVAKNATLHGGSRCGRAMCMKEVVLHGGSRIDELHCVASTNIVKHGGSSVKKRINHPKGELVRMCCQARLFTFATLYILSDVEQY